jgi:hypothetical protein
VIEASVGETWRANLQGKVRWHQGPTQDTGLVTLDWVPTCGGVVEGVARRTAGSTSPKNMERVTLARSSLVERVS